MRNPTSEPIIHSGAGQSLRALLNPAAAVAALWRHRELTVQMARRDIAGRYRASVLGLLWSIIHPLSLLAIYTFVFAVVFKARWNVEGDESPWEFALYMFSGMLVFNLFAELVNRAPTLIADNANYVKKVVFPLEVFVVAALLASLFNLCIGLGVWVVGWIFVMQSLPPWTIVWFPVVLMPVALISLGVSWVLAALGVFVRDVGHAVLLLTQILFFATPIFYPIERVPEKFRVVMHLNPLSHAVDGARQLLTGQRAAPDLTILLISTALAAVIALLGYAFFMKAKRAFSDVL